ncbi:MAG: glycosyltransferase family 2 protein [Bacteroidota bacterium]|nr:glycosyltransferase family 2 protein [Bacteroidota bacterium]
MKESPNVFIIVLTWNGKQDTLDCLDSLQHLTYPNFKIIVVDNASVDGAAEIIQQRFRSVELIVNNSNLRFAGGNNIGIKRALAEGAEYVLLLNNDTIIEKDFLSNLIEASESDDSIGMVGPKIYYHNDPNHIWYAGGKIEWWKGWVSHVGVHERDKGQYDSIRKTDYISGCCILVKRKVIQKIGVLDERFYIYGEDADWCIRASRSGFKLLYVPSAKIWHKLSVSAGGHFSWFKNWNKFKSQVRLMIRYARLYHWLSIPFFMIFKIIQSFVRVKKVQ